MELGSKHGGCTELAAIWCPVCGDCACERSPGGEPYLDAEACPLHSVHSAHAETVELEECQEKMTALAEQQHVSLTAHDHQAVSRFAQYLSGRSRQRKLKSWGAS